MPLILKSARISWLPWVIALIPFFITAATVIALILTDTATPQEAALPFAAMSLFSIAIFLIIGIPIWLSIQWERRAIRRLRDTSWVCWPQYNSVEAWRGFAQREYARELAATRLPWVTFILLVVIFTFVTGFTLYLMNSTTMTTSPLVILLPLGVMFTIIMMMTMGGRLAERRASRARYRRRQRTPIPNVYIGARDLYDDDDGYYSFSGWSQKLTHAEYQNGQMRFSFRITYWSSSAISQDTIHKSVHVPSGNSSQAEDLLARLRQEKLIHR